LNAASGFRKSGAEKLHRFTAFARAEMEFSRPAPRIPTSALSRRTLGGFQSFTALSLVGKPILSAAQVLVDDSRVTDSEEVGELVELMAGVKALELNISRILFENFAIEADVQVANFDGSEERLHVTDPAIDVLPGDAGQPPRFPILARQILPGGFQFDTNGECERFAAAHAGEEPAAPAPRAIHLWRIRNSAILALAVANDIVVRLFKVNDLF
jgi:hypothetical protein